MGLLSWLHHRFMVPRADQDSVVQHGAILPSLERPTPFLRTPAVLMETCIPWSLPALGPADVSMLRVRVQVVARRLAWNVYGVALKI